MDQRRPVRVPLAICLVVMAATLAVACQRPPRSADSTAGDATTAGGTAGGAMPAALIGPTWSLTELNGQPAPLGAGDRPATVVFEAGTTRAAGFAGCNRWSSAFSHTAPDSLQFTAPLSTKMACPGGGMELEQKFLEFITSVRQYALADSVLTLRGERGAEAKFARR